MSFRSSNSARPPLGIFERAWFELSLLYFFYAPLAWVVVVVFLYRWSYIWLLLFALAALLYRTFSGFEFRVSDDEKPGYGQRCLIPLFNRFFPGSVHATERVVADISRLVNDDNRKMIFGVSPHGVMALGQHVLSVANLTLLGLPKMPMKRLVASLLLKLPGMRELCECLGCVDAGRPTAVAVIESDKFHLSLFPGGEREQMLNLEDSDVVYLERRRGFVSLAIQYRCSLVPVYVFGETELFKPCAFWMGCRAWLVQNCRFSFPSALGRSILCPLFPRRVPLNAVLGRPIVVSEEHVGRQDEVEIVDLYKERYIEELKRVHEEYKAHFGYGERTLKVV